MEILAYIVLAMIIYDLSVHLLFLFGKEDFFLKRHINYWPEHLSRKRYQQFWAGFWGIAVLLMLIYLISLR